MIMLQMLIYINHTALKMIEKNHQNIHKINHAPAAFYFLD